MNGLTVIALTQLTSAGNWRSAPDPTPSPLPAFVGNPDLVSPGWLGFLVIFLIAVATVLLIIDMTKRIRRVRYRSEIRERLEGEKDG
jgi:hypothetical protein